MDERSVRVLLVDDEEELVLFLGQRLRARGLQVLGANRCGEALDLATRHNFDVAVVDLKMPGRGGLETLKGLKDLQPMLEVIMLTGHATFHAALESGRLDALRFLEKPFDFEVLFEEVREASERKRRTQSSAYLQEITDMFGEQLSPHRILAETERLRTKYEQ